MSGLECKIISHIIGIEGGYVDDAQDSGGKTRYGITERVARLHGYTGLMSELPYDMAYAIIKVDYWDKLHLSNIEELSEIIAEEIADTAVNTGTYQAAILLQRSLNVFNNRQRYYKDLIADGLIGYKTINALKSYLKKRGAEGELVLHNLLNCLQGEFYANLVLEREKDEKFLYGWIKNRVKIANISK